MAFGCEPNGNVNLTNAGTFAEFVAEIRADRIIHIAFIPQCLEPMPIRRLETVFDILRDYPAYVGRVHWTDRAFYYALDGSIRPLRCAMEGQNPPLVNMFLALLRTMRHPRLKSALRLALAERQELTL